MTVLKKYPQRIFTLITGSFLIGMLLLSFYPTLIVGGVISGDADVILVLNKDENAMADEQDSGEELREPGVDLFLESPDNFDFVYKGDFDHLMAYDIFLSGIAMDIPLPPPKC